MNYQYIEQLLDRYWEGRTTLEEEQILRSFFSQPDIPEDMRQYAPLFRYETEEKDVCLGKDFDARMSALLDSETKVKAKRIRLTTRFAPLLKAAALIAVAITIGNISERTMQTNSAGAEAVTAGDTYTRKEDITAKIKIIDKNRSDAMAKTDSLGQRSSAVGQEEVTYE